MATAGQPGSSIVLWPSATNSGSVREASAVVRTSAVLTEPLLGEAAERMADQNRSAAQRVGHGADVVDVVGHGA